MSNVPNGYSVPRLVGTALVVALHVAIVLVLVNGLSRTTVEVAPKRIETRIIDAPPAAQPEPTPLPPPSFAPPLPFVPPPDIRIAKPPVREKAIVAVAPEKPPVPAPAPVAAAPAPHETVRAEPRLDLAHSREPEYPPASRRLGEQGSLIMQVLVGADGRVSETKLLQSSGFPRLDEAALAGIKDSYRFTPGTVDGKTEAMWFTFKFTWKLR